jgi:hypothetical protein
VVTHPLPVRTSVPTDYAAAVRADADASQHLGGHLAYVR